MERNKFWQHSWLVVLGSLAPLPFYLGGVGEKEREGINENREEEEEEEEEEERGEEDEEEEREQSKKSEEKQKNIPC